MAKIEFKPGTMLNPVPAVMVSCGDETEQNIITIAWTGIVNTDPPMTYISVRDHSAHRGVCHQSDYEGSGICNGLLRCKIWTKSR